MVMDAGHWLFGAALAGLAGLLWRERRQRRELGEMLGDLSAGRRPSIAYRARRSSLSAHVEDLWEAIEKLTRRAAEEAFSLKAILSSMAEGLMVTDERRMIRLVNESFGRLFDLKETPVGRSALLALRETSIEEIVRTTIDKQAPQSREITVIKQSPAETRCFAVNAVPLEDREGKANGAVVVFHDITKLRQLETVRREFVSNVSHELRTPLSIFHGYVENLLDDPDLPLDERTEALRIMKRHSLRLNALIEDLLTLARLESKRIKFEPVSVRIAPFLEQIAVEWAARLAEKRLTIEIDAASDLPPLTADVLRLEQVFNNLVDNAIKYTPPGGRISISARSQGGHLCMRVKDSGQGIPPPDLPHIFERFYRVEKARSREGGGTGLGLSIVKHIVAMHGGFVEADSAYGKGTTISVCFPQTSEDLAEA
jgi:two-component system phosphate regulon sensor histidine kinase PhoR